MSITAPFQRIKSKRSWQKNQKSILETMTEKGERGSFAKVKRFIELENVTTTSPMIDDDLLF